MMAVSIALVVVLSLGKTFLRQICSFHSLYLPYFCPISLDSCLSKVLERIILNQYSSILSSHHLQFGFKTGSSTSLCTGIVKCVVSRYLQNGSSVLGCFLDTSKAFHMVNHCKLFSILEKRGLLIQSFVFYLLGIVLNG